MPRNVRPAYMTLTAEGVATKSGTGPRAKDGWLSASLTLRTDFGAVSEPIKIIAGGPSRRAEIRIPNGAFEVERHTEGKDIVLVIRTQTGQ